MRRSPSLRTRFALLIALLIATVTGLLGSLIGQDASLRIRQDAGSDLAEAAFQMIDRLDRDMASRAGYLQVLGQLRALRQPDDLGEVRTLLDRLQASFPSIAWIGFTDAQGQVLASSNGVLEGASIAQRPVFLEGSKGLFIGDVHEAVLLAKLLPNPSGEAMKFVDISLPVQAADGRLVGVLASHLSWTWADEVRLALLEPLQQRRHVEFLVIGRDHSILLGPRELIGQRLDLPALDDEQKDSHWAVQQWPDGQRYLTGVAPSRGHGSYTGLGWTVIARQSLNEADAPVQGLLQRILLWGCVLALLFALLGWLLSGYFTRPLRQIAEAADHLSASGIGSIPEVRGSREIELLSESIRHLVDSLSHQHRALGVMENLAHHDALTGLANRTGLEKYLPPAQQHSRTHDSCLALLYLDLDGFKPINDRLGHSAGDQLLRTLAERLRQGLREGDLVARLGGDEFVMVLHVPRAEALHQARQIAQRTLQILGQPVDLDKQPVQVGCSIGGAIWPLDGEDLDQVMELADQALYRAKHAGKHRAVFYGQAADQDGR